MTLGDITGVYAPCCGSKQVPEPALRKAFPNTYGCFLTSIHQPQFQEVLGEVMFCEKMAQSDDKKFPESQSKKEIPRKGKGAARRETEGPGSCSPRLEKEMDQCAQALAVDQGQGYLCVG